MRILILADTYVPARISAALQLRDLAVELVRMGHATAVVVPTPDLDTRWKIENLDGVDVLRVRAARTKGVGLIRRALSECALPWLLLRAFLRGPLGNQDWDGVAWYSPTIFLGAAVRSIKKRYGCRSYLILRDLFPDWAVDAGVLRKGLVYYFFKQVERFQYRIADVIGVQTHANLPFVARYVGRDTKIEVLHNWLREPKHIGRSAAIPERFSGRTIFVYTGNMGLAQDMDAFFLLAKSLRENKDLGFLFVGRGSEISRFRRFVREENLGNVEIQDEVASELIPSLLRQCHIGIVALDPRHTTHNIPGKFISYLQAGLPVLARVNTGNDLLNIIEDEGVGIAVGSSCGDLQAAAERLATEVAMRRDMGLAGRRLAERMFSPSGAALQLVDGLKRRGGVQEPFLS